MIKTILKPEEWNELKKLLAKFQIGYTVSYDDHGKSIIQKLIQINPIDVHYYFDNEETNNNE